MKKLHLSRLGVAVFLVAISLGVSTVGMVYAQPPDPVINEFVFNHTGSDTDEFVEVFGAPNTDYSGFTIVEIEGDGSGAGRIDDGTFTIGTTDPSGFWTTGFHNNIWENGTVTLLLVEGYTGAVNQDLDTNNDGVFDVPIPWTRVVDGIAVFDGGGSDRTYASVVLAAYYDGNRYSPGGASRIPNGFDSDTASDWVRNHFGGEGLPSFPTAVSPAGFALNTPGVSNQISVNPPDILTIPEIQGDDQFSSFVGAYVQTSGVVTLITRNGRDAWIQDADGDGDPTTSDGIFIDDFNTLSPKPALGDLIVVRGEVEEQQFGTQLPRTRIDDTVLISIESSGNVIPPIELSDLPNEGIPAGIDFYEPLEGMLVSGSGPIIAPTNGFGEFGFVAEADTSPGSGYFSETSHLIIRSTGTNQVDYNPERIMVDDAGLDTPDVRPGDYVDDLVGVVDYTFGNYKLQLGDLDVTMAPIPSAPVSERTFGDGGKGLGQFVRVVTYNVENLFDLADEPGKDDIGTGGDETEDELETHLAKLALSIEEELLYPEIIVLQEVENTLVLTGDEDGYVPGTSVPALIPRLRGQWDAISFETSDGRGIEVAFLWQRGRVHMLEAFQITEDVIAGTDAAFGSSSPSPGREPLVGLFKVLGEELWIIGNHFKSKGGDDPLYGVNQPPVRVTEVQRKAQAQVVRDFVNTILDDDPDALVMVTGDLNDFQFGEPSEGTDHPVAIIEGGTGEVPLTNLIPLEDDAERFTFVFDGNSQILDHILVSPALLQTFEGVDILHFNAGYPASLGDDPSSPLRASDHDPVEGRFRWVGGKK